MCRYLSAYGSCPLGTVALIDWLFTYLTGTRPACAVTCLPTAPVPGDTFALIDCCVQIDTLLDRNEKEKTEREPVL